MINKVIILGGHIQALGLLRQAKEVGVKTILFIEDGYSVSRFSKAVDEVVIHGSMQSLLSMLDKSASNNTLLFPTSDNYIEFLDENRDYLQKRFVLGIPSKECVEIFSNKRNTYLFSKENDICQPKAWLPEDVEDVVRLSGGITYPVVLKPALMYSFHKMFGKKAFLCMNKEALIEKSKEIYEKYPLKDIILQEFLSGGAPTLYSYGVFAINGTPKAWIMANRIRQNPMDFGNSTTFAVTCNIPEIVTQAKVILQKTNYTGLAEVEFMYDRATNEYKFLEINTRAWKWHSISKGAGFGFLSEMLLYLNNKEQQFVPQIENFAWVERLTDYTIVTKELLKKKMKLKDVLKTYRMKKVSAVWDIKDPLPAVMYLLQSPILFIKRY